ncbi:MAG: hypothetical protein JKY08_05535 [Flavobacteriaceae bacterium]|nr:hypothetical protein [Flavobacteriaceae bacterium]
MKKTIQLKAWFFTSVIVLMTLLNALPHLHHDHQEVTHDTSEVHHHHGDSEHHHPAPEKPTEVALDFSLNFLLDNHLHAVHTHDFLQLVKRNTRFVLKKQVLSTTLFVHQINVEEHCVKPLLTFENYLNSYYNTPLIVNAPLRGPPQLG